MNALKNLQKHLMTSTSYMIPFVVAGGILFAISVMLSGEAAVPDSGWLAKLNQIGAAGLTLFIPILGGYIAFSMADKPGLAPGMIGAYLANEIGAGFIGGIIAGFLAGYVVNVLKKIKLSPSFRTIGTIFIYPLGGTFIVGFIIVFLIGEPIAVFMEWMTTTLNSMSGAAKVPLGGILGSMIAFDMGGPVNKVAATFAQTQVDTLPFLMGGVGVAICVPPIGLGLATLFFPKKFTSVEKDSGIAALLMGGVGITEGAIPFATADPLKVIPSLMAGSVVGNISAFLFGALNHAPWGGLIVLPVVEGRFGYLVSVLLGACTTAVALWVLKKDAVQEESSTNEETEEEDLDDLEITIDQL
ncbi:PTS fructose transporter subunit EIIC [Pontibacillus yanchengensis]|uniref:PTS fructose transporter subunit IIC n=1 Tax=Pontibacillus yanchengensis Y32 TaxID=1385514 RepID=A0A0A2TAV8_9BACI|nr:PTS fructose transporter subunit EIIC [Pontibacillus yanchengensis]KGP72689.1 PTS fructose transporter subunit IIC [Pontibacillus yanchengensis Y32]